LKEGVSLLKKRYTWMTTDR